MSITLNLKGILTLSALSSVPFLFFSSKFFVRKSIFSAILRLLVVAGECNVFEISLSLSRKFGPISSPLGLRHRTFPKPPIRGNCIRRDWHYPHYIFTRLKSQNRQPIDRIPIALSVINFWAERSDFKNSDVVHTSYWTTYSGTTYCLFLLSIPPSHDNDIAISRFACYRGSHLCLA